MLEACSDPRRLVAVGSPRIAGCVSGAEFMDGLMPLSAVAHAREEIPGPQEHGIVAPGHALISTAVPGRRRTATDQSNGDA
jgi:hypothetical protein